MRRSHVYAIQSIFRFLFTIFLFPLVCFLLFIFAVGTVYNLNLNNQCLLFIAQGRITISLHHGDAKANVHQTHCTELTHTDTLTRTFKMKIHSAHIKIQTIATRTRWTEQIFPFYCRQPIAIGLTLILSFCYWHWCSQIARVIKSANETKQKKICNEADVFAPYALFLWLYPIIKKKIAHIWLQLKWREILSIAWTVLMRSIPHQKPRSFQ